MDAAALVQGSEGERERVFTITNETKQMKE